MNQSVGLKDINSFFSLFILVLIRSLGVIPDIHLWRGIWRMKSRDFSSLSLMMRWTVKKKKKIKLKTTRKERLVSGHCLYIHGYGEQGSVTGSPNRTPSKETSHFLVVKSNGHYYSCFMSLLTASTRLHCKKALSSFYSDRMILSFYTTLSIICQWKPKVNGPKQDKSASRLDL